MNNGTAVAVWREERGTNDAGAPQVAINANGHAMVVWVQTGTAPAGTSRAFKLHRA